MSMRALFLAMIAYFFLHWLIFFTQAFVLRPLQSAVLKDCCTVLLVVPLHGLRVLFAWYFGLWSLLIMAPTAAVLLIYFWSLSDFAYLNPWIFLVAGVYMASALLAFKLLKLCLGPRGHPCDLEWRMIMLAGLISALLNVLAEGLFNPPDVAAREALIWMSMRLFSYINGLLLILLLLLAVLRQIGARTQKVAR